MNIWVLVADNSRARLFSTPFNNGELEERESFVHPDSRLHDRDLTSDLPGRAFDRLGGARHAMEQRIDPKHVQAIDFAQQLIAYLEDGRVHHRFDRLYVVAPPTLLGLLRDRYGHLGPMVAGELAKDLSLCTPKELSSHLPERL
jgi:protein required for attachment to host cells